MIKTYNGFVRGNEPLGKQINVKNLLSIYASDPLFPFIDKLEGYHSIKVMEDNISMYQKSYAWYYLSLERFLRAMSVALRWSRGPYWAHRERRVLTKTEKELDSKYKKIERYIYLDFYNCLIYARILLDRVAGLSRWFLTKGNRPSFTSFGDHKKFFKKTDGCIKEYDEYASYIRDKTAWFDTPLKEVRDHFIVHAASRHLHIFGYPAGDNELSLMLQVPVDPAGPAPLASVDVIHVSIPRIAEEVHRFLSWFNRYALRKTDFKNLSNKSLQRTPASGGR